MTGLDTKFSHQPKVRVMTLPPPTLYRTPRPTTVSAPHTSLTLGCILILCGTISATFEILAMTHHGVPTGTGVWTSVIFILTGVLNLSGTKSGTLFLTIATIVMSSFSALSAATLVIVSTILIQVNEGDTCRLSYYTLIVTGATCLLASLASLILSSWKTCCRPSMTTEGRVHSPSTPYSIQFPNLPTALEDIEPQTPGKYQRF